MQKLAELCVRRPVFATVLVLALVVVGAFAYFQLGSDRFPKVEFPFVTVVTVLPGAAPEEIETEVTDKIEEAVNTISGIEELISASSENVSSVQISFVLEKDGDVAAQEVRDKVSSIMSQLPSDVEAPIIQKMESDSMPVISIALSGPGSEREVSEYADKTLRRRLETVIGIGQVTLVGSRPRQINIVTNGEKLSSLGLTAADVVNALRSQNVQIPGGKVEQGLRDLTLRTYGRVGSPGEFGELPVADREGQTIRVRDVAAIEDSVAEAESIGTVKGRPAVILQMRKQSGTNTVAVIDAVKARVEELRPQLPTGYEMQMVQDQSDFIVEALNSVKEHLILGSMFAALIVWFFLSSPKSRDGLLMILATFAVYGFIFEKDHLAEYVPLSPVVWNLLGIAVGLWMMVYFFRKSRPTIIAAVAIPSSLIATFAAMAYMGFTLNIITLLALTLAVGIVIDDAVVVLENIFRHMEEKKLSAMEAAVTGTREVGLAVLATSLSLIAVFLPVAFMGGIVGKFMNSFGVTMAFAIAVSLIVSFTLTPMMSSRWLSTSETSKGHGGESKGIYGVVERRYMRMLEWSMKHRWVIVVIMLVTFFSTVPLIGIVDKTFLPYDDESQFSVSVRAPEGSSLQTTRTIVESIDKQVRKFPEVENTVLTVGDDFQKTQNLGSLYVKLVPSSDRDFDQYELMQRVRSEILPQYQRLNIRPQVAPVNAFGGGADAEIMFWLGGPDLTKLDGYSKVLVERIRNLPGVADVDTNFVIGKPELGVQIDRAKAADLGVRVQDIAATLNVLVGGQQATSYYEGGEEYEVHVRAEAEARRDEAGISQMRVPSSSGGTVPLTDVVTLEEGTGPSLINRINRRRQVMILANMTPGFDAQSVMDELTKGADELKMPAAYNYAFTGRSAEQTKAMKSFMFAFILSIIFMYLILAAQFESWIHPVTILLSLPMTVPFALLSLVILNQSLNIFSMLGILVLFGIVKKNSILQVDHTNGLRSHGMPRDEAIMQANKDRLRPILMTTLAFVAGMLPLVASGGVGAATNRAIGATIIGGQTLALLLTLIGTPVLYSIFDDWANAPIWQRFKSKASKESDHDFDGVLATD